MQSKAAMNCWKGLSRIRNCNLAFLCPCEKRHLSQLSHARSLLITKHGKVKKLMNCITMQEINRKPFTFSSSPLCSGKYRKTQSSDFSKEDNLVVCVEGNVGSGKTTLLNYFQNMGGCEVLLEPVEKWRNVGGHNVLELMYQDPARWSMALQTYIQLTMLQNHTKPMTHAVRLMERSIFGAKYCFVDSLHSSGIMPELEHIILSEWFDWILQTQDFKVDLIVYLRTDPEILHKRIVSRGRNEEKSLPLEYLKRLHNIHEDWLMHKKYPCPDVLVLDANKTLEEMERIYDSNKDIICRKPGREAETMN